MPQDFLHIDKGLSTRKAGRGHATPHMPVETAKCWWLLKIEPNAWAGGKGSCAVCVDLQAVGALKFFGEFYSLAKGFGPFLRGVWAGFRESEGSIFSNHQHFAVSTGICGVACPLPASRVDKPFISANFWGHLGLVSRCRPFLSSKKKGKGRKRETNLGWQACIPLAENPPTIHVCYTP